MNPKAMPRRCDSGCVDVRGADYGTPSTRRGGSFCIRQAMSPAAMQKGCGSLAPLEASWHQNTYDKRWPSSLRRRVRRPSASSVTVTDVLDFELLQ